MKASFARIAAILSLLGSLAALTGFLWLPFGRNPMTFQLSTGLSILQARGSHLSISSYAGHDSQIDLSSLLTYGSLWSLLILSAIMVLLALIWVFLATPGTHPPFAFPLLCLLLSLVAGISLFLGFYDYTIGGENLFSLMFSSEQSPLLPIIGSGWWVSATGLILSLVASLLAIRGSRPNTSIERARETS